MSVHSYSQVVLNKFTLQVLTSVSVGPSVFAVCVTRVLNVMSANCMLFKTALNSRGYEK